MHYKKYNKLNRCVANILALQYFIHAFLSPSSAAKYLETQVFVH